MKTSRLLATAALAFGLIGASSAFAADRDDFRGDYGRGNYARGDYSRVMRLRSEMMQDRMRLEAAMRRGDFRAARRIREDLARDEQRLQYMQGDYYYRDNRNGYNGYNGYNNYDRYNNYPYNR